MKTTTELGIVIPGPAVTPDDVDRLVSVLEQAEGWLTAREIAARIGPPANERTIRAAASAACPLVVSYPGSPGYRLFGACTVEELSHCIEAFQSQGRDMMKRAVVYTQAYHRRFRVAP